MNDVHTAKYLLEGKSCDNCHYFSQERRMNGKKYCYHDHNNRPPADANVCEHWTNKSLFSQMLPGGGNIQHPIKHKIALKKSKRRREKTTKQIEKEIRKRVGHKYYDRCEREYEQDIEDSV